HRLAAYAAHPSVEHAASAKRFTKAGAPNDPLYAQQWGLAKIDWQTAYSSTPITGTATLAILDTGVDTSHPDFTQKGFSGISYTGGDPLTDPSGHGTALAGIAAANVNDGTGIAATGNDGSSAPTYPAGMPNVIGVASTDQNDAIASNSSTGSAQVGAPGVGILTTQRGGGNATISGTSAAAAETAGLAALLIAS